MSSDVAVSVKNLSKIYQVYDNPQDRLKQALWRGKKQFYREFWALRDISLNIKKGRTIGIIGRNGSGKSTLLQAIAGTLTPTSGEVEVNGRIAALLELGSGFNPEFTGRENVYMNGVIMGLSQQEIEERMPYIIKFAEIGEFLDQPVKLYSSGMFVRLAFASAVNVNPDVLIVDEALAVGDTQFQLKCIDKMKTFKKEGKTIIFVSHDVYSVRNFCDEAIWMKDGKIHLRGNVNHVTEQYLDFMKPQVESEDIKPKQPEHQEQINVLSINKITAMSAEDNAPKKEFRFGEKVKVIVDYTLHKAMEGIVGGVAIYDKQNTYVCGLNTKLDHYTLPSEPGDYQLIIEYEQMNLLPGTYYLDVGFFESSAVIHLDYKSRSTYFMVYSGEYFAEGLTYLPHSWSIGRMSVHEV